MFLFGSEGKCDVCVQVSGLRFLRITKGQVLIIWSDHCLNSKCVQNEIVISYYPDSTTK